MLARALGRLGSVARRAPVVPLGAALVPGAALLAFDGEEGPVEVVELEEGLEEAAAEKRKLAEPVQAALDSIMEVADASAAQLGEEEADAEPAADDTTARAADDDAVATPAGGAAPLSGRDATLAHLQYVESLEADLERARKALEDADQQAEAARQAFLDKLEAEREEVRKATISTMEKEMEQRKQEIEQEWQAEVQQRIAENHKEREERVSAIDTLRNKLSTVKGELDLRDQAQLQRRKLNSLVPLLQEALDAVHAGKPLGKTLDEIRAVSEGDPVFEATIGTIPDAVRVHGMDSLLRLRDRYSDVHLRCRQSLFLTRDSGVWGHLYSRLMVAATWDEATLIPLDNAVREQIAKAHYFATKKDDLEAAARELQKLPEGVLAREFSARWITDFKTYRSVLLSIQAMQAHLNSLLA